MLIKTQDGKTLAEVSLVEQRSYTTGEAIVGRTLSDKKIALGVYGSEERCLEIIDEIFTNSFGTEIKFIMPEN